MERTSGGRADDDFESFVAASTDVLFRTGYFMTFNVAETEDLLQETYLRVFEHRHRIEKDPLAYARRTLVNLALGEARGFRRRRAELIPPPREVADHLVVDRLRHSDDLAVFRSAFPALSRQQRAVLFMRYWEDLTESEVARVLGCSTGTVKKTTWRAISRLRSAMGSEFPASESQRIPRRGSQP